MASGGSHLLHHGQHVDLKAEEMRKLADKYAATLLSLASARRTGPSSAESSRSLKTVVVTGTTGRLGCYLLEQLLQKPDVEKVFALNRENRNKKATLPSRQRDSFLECGLDVRLLDSPKLALIAGDTSKDDLGLGESLYHEVRDSVTDIIHNAWRVSFNVPLAANEPLIAGVRNLINLTLISQRTRPPKFVYISSAGAIRNAPPGPCLEAPTPDPRVAWGDGYGESKWVAEQLCLRAIPRGARTTLVRVGQLTGDTRTGSWSPREWVAALIGTASVLHCLPSRGPESLVWLPVDLAASAVIDFLSSEEPVLHLIHPRPTTWDTVFGAAARFLGVPLIPWDQWLAALEVRGAEEAAGRKSRTPAVSLLPFFRNVSAGSASIIVETTKAVANSQTLMQTQTLKPEDFLKSMRYWGYVAAARL